MVVASTMKFLSGKGTTDKIRKPPSLKSAKFVTDASGAIWWPKKELKHVLVTKFSTNKDASPCQKRWKLSKLGAGVIFNAKKLYCW